MTKKQIENMARHLAVVMDMSKDDPARFAAAVKKVDEFFRLAFDLYMISDYDKIEAARREVFRLAMDMYDKEREVMTV